MSKAILLGHLKMSNDKIKEAVLSCDVQILSEPRLRQLEAFAPDKKEVNKSIIVRHDNIISFYSV